MQPTPETPPTALKVRGLCRRYGRTWALADVSFRVDRASRVLVAGHNGSGKSTLLRVLAGALRPDRGTVAVAGDEGRELLRRRTALLSHQAYCYEPLTALQNLRIIARFLARADDDAALMAVLDEVGLAGSAHAPVHTFSAGMRKRLALARLLLQSPDIALLDEPYGELDPQGFDLLERILDRMRARGTAVLLASHLIDRGVERCERALLLARGRLVWAGPSRELLARRDVLPEAV